MSRNRRLETPVKCMECLFYEFNDKSGFTCEVYNKNLTYENVARKIPVDCEEGVKI